MGSIRITIFQKSIHDGLSPTVMKKLTALKSDFLILPEYFYADKSVKSNADLAERSLAAQDWLCKVSESYKGTIVGGSAILAEDGDLYNATPIVSNGMIVDWYRKRNLVGEEKKFLKPGNTPGIFILGGHRFAVLICADVLKPEYYQEIAAMGIKLIFTVMSSPKKAESVEQKHQRDEELFCKPARELGLHIVKCGSIGSILGKELQGRSLVASPTGISWRVAPQEEQSEILKTLIVNLPQ